MFETAYSNEPLVLRLVLLHELLHAFKFGDGNLSLAEISWKRDFSTDMPTVENYHWNVDAQGYHFRSSRPANSELMQPVLNSFTFLSMASLYATEKNVRYACDRNEDCEKGQKCVFDSISWVGTCEHVSKQDSGSDTVCIQQKFKKKVILVNTNFLGFSNSACIGGNCWRRYRRYHTRFFNVVLNLMLFSQHAWQQYFFGALFSPADSQEFFY